MNERIQETVFAIGTGELGLEAAITLGDCEAAWR